MNRLTIALLATAAALAANTLRAETRFSIGVHLGGPAYVPTPSAVVPAPPLVSVYAPPPTVVYAPARGYWKEIAFKIWVPERVVFSRDRWGRSVRICEPGYYTYRTDRVWVESHDVFPPASHRGSYAYGHWGR